MFQLQKRLESAKSIIRFRDTPEEDRKILRQQLQIQNLFVYSNYLLVGGAMMLLYKRNFFEGSSKFLFKEIGLLGCILGEIYGVRYLSSEYFWRNSKDIIRRNAILKEKAFYELKLNDITSEDLYQ